MLDTLWGILPAALEAAEIVITQTSAKEYGEYIKAQEELDEPQAALIGNTSNLFQLNTQGVATIPIKGLLTKERDFFSWLMGARGLTYMQIIDATLAANANEDVKEVLYLIDSPGGGIRGLFTAASAIKESSKPTRVLIEDTCASAALVLATQADVIESVNDVAEVGSLGVVQGVYLNNRVKNITSSNAPFKAPDAGTPEGERVIIERLSALHEKMATMIAAGRSSATGKLFTVDSVNRDFGKGGVFTADVAVQRGMIDKVLYSVVNSAARINPDASAALDTETDRILTGNSTNNATNNAINSSDKTNAQEDLTMTKTELQEKHPVTYAAIVAEGVQQGESAGITKERERVNAHLTLGKASDNMAFAEKCVLEGTAFESTSVQASYIAASMNKTDKTARAADEKELAGIDTPPAATAEELANAANPDADALLSAVMAQSRKPSTLTEVA